MRAVVSLAVVGLLILALLCLIGCGSVQRRLLYFPTHEPDDGALAPWRIDGQIVGCSREVSQPAAVWLFLHGNGGQAIHRRYALPSFSPQDSVFILEYPGYGLRAGQPSLATFNAAAQQAYAELRRRFPATPVCVAAESIGSGPACYLAGGEQPPAKLVLVVPFDLLSSVAGEHFPFLPTRLLLRDNWDNVTALARYGGPLEIFGAADDTVIPIAHARALAASRPQAVFHEIRGGHNDWSRFGEVRIRFP